MQTVGFLSFSPGRSADASANANPREADLPRVLQLPGLCEHKGIGD
jgi:hypothetical protein